MGIVEEEDGVLKSVHPGRYGGIHIQPIAAAQVLENNPRHSITRLDVFEFKNGTQTRNPAALAAKHRNNNRWFKQSLPITSCMGTAFQEQDCDKRIRNPPGKSAGMSPNQHQSLPITSWIVTSFQEHDCDKRDTKPAKVESWPKFISITNHRKIQQVRLDLQIMKKAINLRPGLRKQDSARKVSFNLPVKDEEQRRAVHKTRAEDSGNCSCSSSEIFVHFTNLVSA
ncbi:hypothetical protein OIU74_011730 [Salix koriyanagi]|uniref:Uncharacterized protein n=1 Tax=Salix koriyanagi TaxID=2511006 RepID=A0A9Q0TFY0_9ROSI|nr:hypothetical protein OIU74_011730 [Salix koriyanagi]